MNENKTNTLEGSKRFHLNKLKMAEQKIRYYQKKREREQSVLKEAFDLLSQNREMSLEENDIVRNAEEIKAKRIKISEYSKQYHQKRKAAATPEEIESRRLKRLEQDRQYRKKNREKEVSILEKAMKLLSRNHELSLEENKALEKAEQLKAKRLKKKGYYLNRKAAATPEEVEVMRLKHLEQTRRFRENRKATTTPEELEAMKLKHLEQGRKYQQNKRSKEESVLRQAMELLRQNQVMSSDEREVLRQAETIKAGRLRKSEYIKQYMKSYNSERLRRDQVTSNVPSVIDEIKIEEEVVQESTIKTIPLRQNANPIVDKQLNSSCSWLEHSESFMTGGNSLSNPTFPSFYGGSSSISESFANSNVYSTKLDRRKSGLEESFRCMRVLIDATAKRDGLAVFGKQIAQKLRTSKKDVAEVGIAKQLIDNVLLKLTIGAYNSKTEIV